MKVKHPSVCLWLTLPAHLAQAVVTVVCWKVLTPFGWYALLPEQFRGKLYLTYIFNSNAVLLLLAFLAAAVLIWRGGDTSLGRTDVSGIGAWLIAQVKHIASSLKALRTEQKELREQETSPADWQAGWASGYCAWAAGLFSSFLWFCFRLSIYMSPYYQTKSALWLMLLSGFCFFLHLWLGLEARKAYAIAKKEAGNDD